MAVPFGVGFAAVAVKEEREREEKRSVSKRSSAASGRDVLSVRNEHFLLW